METEALRNRDLTCRSIRPETPEQLRGYVATHCEVAIPHYAPGACPCPGHDSPFAYLAGSFFKDTDGWSDEEKAQFSPHTNCVVHACRSGGKTMMGAISARLKAHFFPGCGIRILGGSSDQSKRMYDNVSRFDANVFRDRVLGEPTQEKTRYKGGSNIEILMASLKSVQGPHVPILMLDEVDEFTRHIYTAAIAIAQSSKNMRATIEQFSTAHHPNGIMQQLIEDAAKSGIRLYRWCIFEVLKKCPYPCTPEKPYKRCVDMVKYDQLNQPHRFSDVCVCRAKKSRGYYPIEDLWQKFEHPMMAWESFAAYYLCEMPKIEDAIFPMIAERAHLLKADMPVETWRDKIGKTWHLIMGADAGPVNSWVSWVLVGRWFEKHDDFWTAVVLRQLVTDRNTATSDFADMVVREHERMGFPKATALFTGPTCVPQDTYLAMELDKPERRGRLFVASAQQPAGRRCIRVESEGKTYGQGTIANMLTMRAAPDGGTRPALLFCKSARPTYDSLACQTHSKDEDHGVASVRYALRGWEIMGNILLNQGKKAVGFACAVSGR